MLDIFRPPGTLVLLMPAGLDGNVSGDAEAIIYQRTGESEAAMLARPKINNSYEPDNPRTLARAQCPSAR